MSICNYYLENKEADEYVIGGVKKKNKNRNDLTEDIKNFIM